MLNKKGFSLVEMLVVIALLGIVTTLAVPNIIKSYNKGIQKSFEVQVDQVKKAAELYLQDYCKYKTNPTNVCGLSGNNTVGFGGTINISVLQTTKYLENITFRNETCSGTVTFNASVPSVSMTCGQYKTN